MVKLVRLTLTHDERDAVGLLLDRVLRDTHQMPLATFLDEAPLIAHDLPRRIRGILHELRLREMAHGVWIENNPVNHDTIGATPQAYRPAGLPETVLHYDAFHILYASLLGEPFAWTTIQDGYIINDIIPLPEHAHQARSSGSAFLFDFHTEDAFHACAGDYIGLVCVRNPDSVATIVSIVAPEDISPASLDVLFEPRYVVGANIAHRVGSVVERSPVLFGARDAPYIRINLNVHAATDSDPSAEHALQELIAALRRNIVKISLQAGDCLFLDNYRTAHGREPYAPRYDGNDRWLRRLYITSYLRKSRHLRSAPDARLLHVE
jgi:L-asparagine oxygenase